MSPERLVHHELCFGCGRTNLFGLLMDVEPLGEGRVRGRAFIKQDHQGPERGSAHEGIVLAAMSDAMALACGPDARARQVELELASPVPVGAFLDVAAEAGQEVENGCQATASAFLEDTLVASARGVYARP